MDSFVGRSSPADITVTPDFDGSPHACAQWAFNGAIKDLSHFYVLVEAEGKKIFDDRVTGNEKRATIKDLRPLTKYKVSVAAVYTDEIQNLSSIDFVHTGMFSPLELIYLLLLVYTYMH